MAQQIHQLFVIVAAAALTPRRAPGGNHQEERWLRRVTISVSTWLPEIACS
jgi:hypothetical protein